MRPVVILVLGALLAGAGYGAAKLYRASQDGPCGSAPSVAAGSVTPTRAVRPVTGRELTGVRANQPPSVTSDYLPASSVDSGSGTGQVRVTVVVSQDKAVDGDAFARTYGLRDANSSPAAVGPGTGRAANADGAAVAAGALDGCTGAVVAGRSAAAVERVASTLRAP